MLNQRELEKLEGTETAWEINAPGAKFYGLTLDEFKAQIQLSRDARELILNLEQQLLAAKNQLEDIDRLNLKLEINVVRAISGDPNFGVDSSLYEATGRVRSSERKTGLTRRRRTAP